MTSIALLTLVVGSLGSPVTGQVPPTPSAAEQALMQSAFSGKLDDVRRLVSQGTAESFARQKGHSEVVALLNDPPPVLRPGPS